MEGIDDHIRLLLPPPDFQLRVNKHYANINAPFREWLQELLRGDLIRAEDWSNHRFDLLCSLCFPTIDPPQLLCVSKLCALTFLANDGLIRAENPSSQWLSWYVSRLGPVSETLNRSAVHGDSVLPHSFLNPDQLLRVAYSVRTEQTEESKHPPHPTSGTNLLRLTNGLFSLFHPSWGVNTQNPLPLGLPEFLITLENTYGRKLSEELTNSTLLGTLWKSTTNIIMWSQDVASYSSRHQPKCDRCTVCCTLAVQGFTLQAAVNDIRRRLQSEAGKFARDYHCLTARACDNKDAVMIAGAMRDCITGFIHWLYEGERYFGKQYEVVAKFGWVFMDTGDTSAEGDEAHISRDHS